MNRKCVYLTEGECEEKLIAALKEEPSLLMPGKVKKFNVIQEELKTSQLVTFTPGSMVVLVFDTDVEMTEHLKKNIELLERRCNSVKVVTVAEVLNFEDELERCTNVAKAQEITRSSSLSEFKGAFCRMKPVECRRSLERHNLDMKKLWCKEPKNSFGFIRQEADKIKTSAN